MRTSFLAVLLVMCGVCLAASGGQAEVGDLTKRAQKVVVARVVAVESAFGTNEHGDQLIYSHLTMEVAETLKGPHEGVISITIEGGTVGGLTLKVSDMPAMRRGETAVLFLNGRLNGYTPTSRGQGVLRLDRSGRVAGTDVTLDAVRQRVKAAGF